MMYRAVSGPDGYNRVTMIVGELLEPRRLMATGFTVSVNDPAGTFAAYHESIRSTLLAAGAEWASHFSGGGVIDVEVAFNPFVPTAQARSTSAIFLRTDDAGIRIDEQAAAHEVRTGVDPNGADAADVQITLGTEYLTDDLWFDPNPAARGTQAATAVPANRTDAYSVMLHELAHAFAFNGNRDAQGTLHADFNNTQTTFDAREVSDGANLYFAGPHTLALRGGQPVALTRNNPFHLGNASGVGSDVADDLLNGVAFVRGRRYFISPLDLAMMADTGLPVVGLAPLATVGNVSVAEGNEGTPGRATFTVTLSAASSSDVTILYSTEDGSATASADYVPASGVLTIPAGQTTATVSIDLVGDAAVEGDETFTLVLSNPSGAVLGTPTATATITNDDAPAPVRTLVVTSKRKATYRDAAGQTVTVSMKGPGTATLIFAAESNDADAVTLAGTTGGSALTISAKRATTVRAITAANPVGSISGKTVGIANGTIDAKVAKSVTLRALTNSAVTLNGPGAVAVSVGTVQGSTVTTTGAVKSVKSTAWTDSTLSAGTVGSLSTTAFTRSTLRAAGAVGTITATTLTGSTIFAAVAAGTAVLPTSLAQFTNTAVALKSLTVKKTFSDTLVAAPTLGTVKLPPVTTTNNGRPFGLVGNTITTLKASTPARKSLTVARATAPAQSYAEGDLVIRVL